MALTLFFLFFVLKQFYIFPSGQIGIADIMLGVCFLFLFTQAIRHLYLQHSSIPSSAIQNLHNTPDFTLYCFLLCVVTINCIYSILYHDSTFLLFTSFWIFNGCAIWCFRTLASKYGKAFFLCIIIAAKGNILIQFVIFAMGKGRLFYEYWGATRYMGTFNDPNQLAFFLFMMILLCYLYHCQYSDQTFPVFYLLGIIPMLASKSTGSLLGMFVFTIAMILWKTFSFWRQKHLPQSFLAAGLSLVIISFIIFLHLIWPTSDFDLHTADYTMLTRIQDKLWKISHGGLLSLVLDRGIDKFMLYPKYLFLGAGEGGFARFLLTDQYHEIHSSLLSLLFCYGIVPSLILLTWLFGNLKNCTPKMWCAVLALLVESFFLINYRQPMFWLILLYGSLAQSQKGPHA